MRRKGHNLSNYKLMTADMGYLYPVQVIDVLPGDSMSLHSSALMRVSPMVAPVMHPVRARFHHWFVPYRIIWDGWEDFITGGPNNDDTQTVPQWRSDTGVPENSLLDYMGVTPGVPNTSVNALPLMAFNKIWNEFYRDQDLQAERELPINTIPRVNWSKDYFTTARPWTQKGPDVTLPLGAAAPIKGLGLNVSAGYSGADVQVTEADGTTQTYSKTNELTNNQGLNIDVLGDAPPHTPNIYADLTQATGLTVNELREYFALQRYAEARARFGSRYVEYLRYLGIRSSDARLQRPEYLGGGKQVIQFSEVIQTAADTLNNTPIGTLRGHGIAALKTRPARRFFEEHGVIITVMSIVPVHMLSQGTPRYWHKLDKEDFYQKELEHIGQQPVFNNEVFLQDVTGRDVFGYSDRYAEYRSQPSQVAGEFRSLMNYWHLAREFTDPPVLNSSFVECNPSKRIFAEQTQHSFWIMVNNKVKARRMVGRGSVGSVR